MSNRRAIPYLIFASGRGWPHPAPV